MWGNQTITIIVQINTISSKSKDPTTIVIKMNGYQFSLKASTETESPQLQCFEIEKKMNKKISSATKHFHFQSKPTTHMQQLRL